MKIIVYIILIVIGIVLGFLLSGIGIFHSMQMSPEQRKENLKAYSLPELKDAVLVKEQDSINNFINIDCSPEIVNTWLLKSAKANIKIKNNASVAVAKDISMMIYLVSKTNSYIDSMQYTWYNYLSPGQTQSFEKDFDFNENLADFKCKFIGAKSDK